MIHMNKTDGNLIYPRKNISNALKRYYKKAMIIISF